MQNWQPSCDRALLVQRAKLLATIRAFFNERQVLEVETPLLGITTGTDPQLDFFSTQFQSGAESQTLYLQTSPEFAMKRLLASGCGSIYQICKAFRNGEFGRLHNPEFTILEWYRVDFDLPMLMQDVVALMTCLFESFERTLMVESYSYREIFAHFTGLDALNFDIDRYQNYAIAQTLPDAARLCGLQHSLWLDFIFTHKVQPFLGKGGLTMVHGYPACQAALAKINQHDRLVAERVELFMQGIELGNGFFELTDAAEQEQRFEQEQALRIQSNLPFVVKDEKFLAALRSGLPSCAGIAIGLDRLLMVLNSDSHIEQVLAFPFARI